MQTQNSLSSFPLLQSPIDASVDLSQSEARSKRAYCYSPTAKSSYMWNRVEKVGERIWKGKWKGSSMAGPHKCVLNKGTSQGASYPAKLSFYYNENADTHQIPII